MARVYSHSESRAKGSVGMTTYRTIRGRVIQSQKVSPWDPSVEAVGNATRWNPRTALLGIISLFCSFHAQSIINSFNRTKVGSQRNYFMKRNYAALKAAFAELAAEYAVTKVAPTMEAIEEALAAYAEAHPNTIYRVKKTGYDIVFLDGAWDDEDDPSKPVVVSNMEGSLNENYQLVSVSLQGRDMSQALKFKLQGNLIDGTLVIASDGKSAIFTPANAPTIVGIQTLDAVVGTAVKNSINIAGDLRDRGPVEFDFTAGDITAIKVDGVEYPIASGATSKVINCFLAGENASVELILAQGKTFNGAEVTGSDENMAFNAGGSAYETNDNPFVLYFIGSAIGDNKVDISSME